MEANNIPSSPGFNSLEATCSSPPPHASQAPMSSVLVLPSKSGPQMEANDVSFPPGFNSLETTRSSPPPHASQAPTSSAPDPPPPRPSSPLEVVGPSASVEGSQQGGLKLQVHLVIGECFKTVEVAFQPSKMVRDIKDYFEIVKRDVCSAENMVIYHDGTKLSNMTLLETLDLDNWNDILITDQDRSVPISGLTPIQEAMVDEGLVLPIDYLPLETENEDFELLRCEYDVSPSQEAVESVGNHFDCTTTLDYDYPSMLGQSDIAVMSTAIGEIPLGIAETALTTTTETAPTYAETTFHTDETSPAETAIPTAETALTMTAETVLPSAEIAFPCADTSENLVTSSCSQVLIGRLVIPMTLANFPDRILSENQLHGFKTVNELINEVNRGPPRWITKKQALGLLYNAAMFSVSDVKYDAKKDGLSCVINSTKCQISCTLRGYSAAANVQSSENLIGKMKEKGVEMYWFEVRGKLWSRRRLVLRGGDGAFHLLQWKQHQNTETDPPAARTSTLGDQTTEELRHMVSDAAAARTSTSGEQTTEELRHMISAAAAAAAARTSTSGDQTTEEMRHMISDAGAAKTSTPGDHTTEEPRHMISDAATAASTLGERRTQVLGDEICVGARAEGFEEMRGLIQDFQTAVCAQFKEFHKTVSTQLFQFDSHLHKIETRVEAIEQQRSSTLSLGPTL